jgi:hypothetical protein
MNVVRHLLHDHKLEQDVVLDILKERGQFIRDSVKAGMPADSIANEVANADVNMAEAYAEY